MWFISIFVSLSILHQSHGVQDEFLSLENGNPIRRESLATHGCNQNITPPHLQVPESSSSLNLMSRICQAGDPLLQPAAPPYPLETVATLSAHAWRPAAKHLSIDLPLCPFSETPGSLSNRALQQPNIIPEKSPNNLFHHSPSQSIAADNGIISDEDFYKIASYLIDEEPSTSALPYNTTPTHGVSLNLASASDLAPHLDDLSWMQLFKELQHESSEGPSPMLGFSTGFSHSSSPEKDLNQEKSDGIFDYQSSNSFQAEVFSTGFNKKRKTASSTGSEPMVEKTGRGRKHTSQSKPINASKDSCDKTEDKSIRRRGHGGRRSQYPEVIPEEVPNVDNSEIVWMTYLAPRLQSENQKMVMIEDTLTKWLPVYKKLFEFHSTNCEIKAKLATLFETLWHMNTWLLHSFNFSILANLKLVHHGHDHMMRWVVHEILHSKSSIMTGPTWKHSSFIWQEYDFKSHISHFLTAERQTKGIWIQKKGKRFVKVEKENVAACQAAVCILEAYYKSSNLEKYLEVFKGWRLTKRLLQYTNARKNQNQGAWKKREQSMFGTVILPWSQEEIPSSEELQKDKWDVKLKELYSQMFWERNEELKMQQVRQEMSQISFNFNKKNSPSKEKSGEATE